MFNCSICLTLQTADVGFQWKCFKIGQEIKPLKWMICLKLVWQPALIQLGPNIPSKLDNIFFLNIINCYNFQLYCINNFAI